MAYNKFTMNRLRQEHQLTITDQPDLFSAVPLVPVSDLLRQILARNRETALRSGSEKARSESFIAPILTEVYEQAQDRATLFSGVEFNVDKKRGLSGFCDYMFTLSPNTPDILAPIVSIVEAKKEDINAGLPQCLAELVAAQIFNATYGTPAKTLFGIVTSGTEWKFLRLEGTDATIDSDIYFLADVEKIVGIVLSMLH